MPVDPSIPLSVTGGGGPNAPAVVNPLGMMHQALTIQHQGIQNAQGMNALSLFPLQESVLRQDLAIKQNEIAKFQQEFAARQRAGQIIAGAPDANAAEKLLLADPLVAAWGLPHLTAMRQLELTGTQIRGETQVQLVRGAEALPKLLVGAAGNPGALPGMIGMWSASQPEAIRRQLAGPAAALITSIMPEGTMGLPPGQWSEAQHAQYKKNMAALMVAAGTSPATAELAFGTPGETDVNGTKVPIITDRTTGGQRIPGGPLQPSSGTGGPGTSVNPLQLTPRDGEGPAGPPLSAPPVGPGSAQAPSGADRLAGNGVPLSAGLGTSPNAGIHPTTGLPIPQNRDAVNKLAEQHIEGEKKYNSAQNAQGTLALMNSNLDTIAGRNAGKEDTSNFLTPGTLGELRVDIGNAINTARAIVGKEPLVDPVKEAAGQSLIKLTQIYGIEILTTLLGNQREAANTISNITTKGTPSITNSYLGAKLIMAGNQAAAQRIIDEHEFRSAWAAKKENDGNLQGADAAFNKRFPAESYMTRVLDQFGMDASGKFVSPDAVDSALTRGLLTPSQHTKILKEQFGHQ